MNKEKLNLLSKNQLTFLIMGFALGPAIFRLPNVLCEIAQQDAWISAIIALVHPIYMLIIANYIISNHPKENLLILNKVYFGYIFGTILNSIFLLQFIFYLCTIMLDFSNISRIYIVTFLTPVKVILVTMLLCVYACNSGIKVLAKITEIISFVLIFVIMLTFITLNDSSILNIQPIMGSNLSNILLATTEATYFYTGFEFILLYHPFAKDVRDIKKSSIKAIAIAGLIWIWTVFITIYYLGIDIIPKSFYSFILVFEPIKIPIINNFRYIVMFTMTLVAFRIISLYFFSASFILSQLINIDIKKINILLSPIVFFVFVNIMNNLFNNEQLVFFSKIFVVFNIITITILSLLVFIKSKSKTQNQS